MHLSGDPFPLLLRALPLPASLSSHSVPVSSGALSVAPCPRLGTLRCWVAPSLAPTSSLGPHSLPRSPRPLFPSPRPLARVTSVPLPSPRFQGGLLGAGLLVRKISKQCKTAPRWPACPHKVATRPCRDGREEKPLLLLPSRCPKFGRESRGPILSRAPRCPPPLPHPNRRALNSLPLLRDLGDLGANSIVDSWIRPTLHRRSPLLGRWESALGRPLGLVCGTAPHQHPGQSAWGGRGTPPPPPPRAVARCGATRPQVVAPRPPPAVS